MRVFGCAGSTDVVGDAIDWAVANDMQVINMSLGSSFGTEESSEYAIASTNAEEAAVIAVASAGNSGTATPIPYIVGSPSTGDKTVSVAAVESHTTFAGASLALTPSGTSIDALQNNNAAVPTSTLNVYVVPDAAGEPAGIGGVGLGCLDTDYPDAQIAGKLVVAARGTCARIYRLQAAFKHGAAAVALVNNGAGFGIFEGDVMSRIPGATPDNANGRPATLARRRRR